MKKALRVELHDGAFSTTTDVWRMLVASRDGLLEPAQQLVESCRQLLTCQYDYTSPLHLAVREGHLDLVRYYVDEGALDPTYRTHPFLEPLVTVAEDRGYDEIVSIHRHHWVMQLVGVIGKLLLCCSNAAPIRTKLVHHGPHL